MYRPCERAVGVAAELAGQGMERTLWLLRQIGQSTSCRCGYERPPAALEQDNVECGGQLLDRLAHGCLAQMQPFCGPSNLAGGQYRSKDIQLS